MQSAYTLFVYTGLSLLWVFILGMIFLYIYALVAFGFFRDLHDPNSGMQCSHMYECFINLVHKGMILSTLEVRQLLTCGENNFLFLAEKTMVGFLLLRTLIVFTVSFIYPG